MQESMVVVIALNFSLLLYTGVRADHLRDSSVFSEAIHGHNFQTDLHDWCTRHFFQDQYALAAVDCDKALSGKNPSAELYSNFSAALIFLRHFKQAEAAASSAISLDPTRAIHFYNRGLARDQQGQHDAAVGDYSTAIERNPYFSHAYVNRGLAWRALGNFEAARQDLETAQTLQEIGARK